jgi:hypothetical protein
MRDLLLTLTFLVYIMVMLTLLLVTYSGSIVAFILLAMGMVGAFKMKHILAAIMVLITVKAISETMRYGETVIIVDHAKYCTRGCY